MQCNSYVHFHACNYVYAQGGTTHRQQAPVERQQLVHELQELRIELSHKTMALENLESDYRRKIIEMEHKLGEAMNQKQLLQVTLNRSLHIFVNCIEDCRFFLIPL